ncbi:N-acetylmuramoyl-L-alanine amidase [Streptomyces sp. GXMU-J5]|uniref:N-acetylmuramoyl-L-alanine amidase n=1 Tax=Streptomyces beihaiensis TaxID=2984495 RepID=A0ABT3U361_9ACTN|nr:N-acetylmuramoyl-L-alanine amidase [Streptomyces beihaiensis]MCX3063755.1 N-acetylmuramoyl-L-alanine amidase [Streptomyces beihaiensis]
MGLAAGGVLAVVATGIAAVAEANPSPDSAPKAASDTALQSEFASAAREFKVPQSVLMAVAYQQSRWDTHAGKPSMTGNYNVMGLTQVSSTQVHKPSTSERTRELNLRGEEHPGAFHPSKHVLAEVGAVQTGKPALHTLDRAAKLIGTDASSLRSDRDQSVRGGAALLAEYERAATGGLPTDPAQWSAAVARFSQSPDSRGAAQFTARVYAHMRSGISRVTADGQRVTLPPQPGLRPQATTAAYSTTGGTSTGTATATDASYVTGTTTSTSTMTPECPSGLTCNVAPAAYQQTSSTDKTQYGNYDIANRPTDGDAIKYIVIHDTESSYSSAVSEFQDPTAGASAHYVVRSSDGLVTQMVPTKDVAWHAGNWYTNEHSVGIEHEGFALKGGSWYTESEYESSAALVKYLANKYGVPLDREHIIGHDDVEGPLDAYVSGMHWDPGTYWDWNHYMSLLGAPTNSNPAGSPLVAGEVVRIAPPFSTSYEPTVSGQSAQPANFVYLRTSPSSSASLISNPYFSSGTTVASDWGDKAVAGQDFVVATQQGDWTAIWYGGKEAWFHNPHGAYTVPVSDTSAFKVVTARDGVSSIPVYGRAYPEASAYPTGLTAKPVTPLTKYSIPAGQAYVAIAPEKSSYYRSTTFDGSSTYDRTVISGTTTYYPIRFNHRLGYLSSADVKVVAAVPPPAASKRQDLIARDASGYLWEYQGTGGTASYPFLSRYKIGHGWGTYTLMTAMSVFHADGTGDLVAIDGSGYLWYYQGSGNPTYPLKRRVKAGHGWTGYTILGMGDLTGDGKADLLARDKYGYLYVYPGTGDPTSPIGSRTKVGHGWTTYTMVNSGDVNGDGKPDLLARDKYGYLYVYPGTGSLTSPFGSRVKAGHGWTGYTMVGAGDLNGDGKPDLVARDSSGELYLYPGTGSETAPYSSRKAIGGGWNIYNSLL